eukprot:6187744-Pleurochrysis_carterae.AAC.6
MRRGKRRGEARTHRGGGGCTERGGTGAVVRGREKSSARAQVHASASATANRITILRATRRAKAEEQRWMAGARESAEKDWENEN